MSLDVHEVLDDWVAAFEGVLAAPVEAEKVIAHMLERDPKAVEEWLWSQLHNLVTKELSRRLQHERRRVVEQDRSPDFEPEEALDVPYSVDGQWTRLRHLTHSQIESAAHLFEKQRIAVTREGIFLRTVQKRLPEDNSKRVEDEWTADAIMHLRRRVENQIK